MLLKVVVSFAARRLASRGDRLNTTARLRKGSRGCGVPMRDGTCGYKLLKVQDQGIIVSRHESRVRKCIPFLGMLESSARAILAPSCWHFLQGNTASVPHHHHNCPTRQGNVASSNDKLSRRRSDPRLRRSDRPLSGRRSRTTIRPASPKPLTSPPPRPCPALHDHTPTFQRLVQAT